MQKIEAARVRAIEEAEQARIDAEKKKRSRRGGIMKKPSAMNKISSTENMSMWHPFIA